MSEADDDYEVGEIARAWLVKMRGDDAGSLRAEFEAWLAAAPAHRAAYDRIARAMDGARVLKTSYRHGSAQAALRQRGSPRRWLSWGAAAAATALFLVAIGAGGAPLPAPLGAGPTARAAEPLITRRGEIRTFRLADGSTATLDTDSRLEIDFSDHVRRVRLAKGRVRLAVAADTRPLEAAAGAAMVRTRAGAFDLDLGAAGEAHVLLLRGTADISAAFANGRSGDAARPLALGERLVYRADRSAPPRPSGAAHRVAADTAAADWPNGWAEYRSIALGSLVAEANRYAHRPIIVEERAVAALAVSGRFQLTEPDHVARRLTSLFDLELSEEADGLHLEKRQKTPPQRNFSDPD